MRRILRSLTLSVSLLAVGLVAIQAPRAGAQAGAARSLVHGIDVAGMDRSVKPGDDFFRYANGTWDRNTPIPPDRSSWGLGAELTEQADRRTRGLLEEAAKSGAPAGSDERRIGDYYTAYMDEAAIEKRGLAAL